MSAQTVKKIGIVGGSGQVGQALATGFIKAGYEVKIGTRDPAKLAEWSKQNPKVVFGSNAEAAQFGDVVVISTNWAGTEEALKQAGKDNLKGKVLLDITNPIVMTAPNRIDIPLGVCGGKIIQGWYPDTHVVKFLNSVGNTNFCFPFSSNGVKPTTFIAGNDANAKATTTKILHSLGWENVLDVGDINSAQYTESLCPIWVNAAFTTPAFAFAHNWAFITKQ